MPISRTRRSILIATLVVVGVVAWCSLTPRVDPRFVGKWFDPTGPGHVVVFSMDGRFGVEGRVDQSDDRWWVSDSHMMFSFTKPSASWWQSAQISVARLLPTLADRMSPQVVGRWRIEDVEEGRFVLRDSLGNRLILTRLAE
jgi:hypothetical protein